MNVLKIIIICPMIMIFNIDNGNPLSVRSRFQNKTHAPVVEDHKKNINHHKKSRINKKRWDLWEQITLIKLEAHQEQKRIKLELKQEQKRIQLELKQHQSLKFKQKKASIIQDKIKIKHSEQVRKIRILKAKAMSKQKPYSCLGQTQEGKRKRMQQIFTILYGEKRGIKNELY